MKRLQVLAVFALSAASAWGTFTVVSSFPCPGQPIYDPEGIDHHAGYIYYVNDGEFYIFKTTETGSLVATFYVYPAITTSMADIACTGTELWIINPTSPIYAYRFTMNGSYVGRFLIERTGYTARGITADSTYVYVSLRYGTWGFRTYTKSGSLVTSVFAPSYGPLDYDGTYFYTGESSRIRKWKTSYQGMIYTRGYYYNAISCQGAYFWFADYIKRYVYKIGAVSTDIGPSSVGRVKALFR